MEVREKDKGRRQDGQRGSQNANYWRGVSAIMGKMKYIRSNTTHLRLIGKRKIKYVRTNGEGGNTGGDIQSLKITRNKSRLGRE